MNHRDIAFNWRATMGNPANVPPHIASYLDLVTELTESDGYFLYRTANRHTCACDDPIVMLDHVRRNGICVTIQDHKLYDEAVNYVRGNKPMYFCDAEVDRRMKNADGDCPMCGFRPSFQSGTDHEGRRSMMTRCQHIGPYSVSGDVDEFLRQPRVWEGKSWPYAWMQGTKLTVDDRVLRENGSAPCQGCLEMEAIERMEKALLKLVPAATQMSFARPGWGSPVSSFWSDRDCDNREDRLYMRVKKVVDEAQDRFGSSMEVRLNDAGLKLFIKPVRSGRSIREVDFGMRVGGDQVADYPGFQDFAHSIFAEMGVPTTTV